MVILTWGSNFPADWSFTGVNKGVQCEQQRGIKSEETRKVRGDGCGAGVDHCPSEDVKEGVEVLLEDGGGFLRLEPSGKI